MSGAGGGPAERIGSVGDGGGKGWKGVRKELMKSGIIAD